MIDLAGKVVAITGASSGIGEAIAYKLAAQGVRLILGARRIDRLEEIVRRITQQGGEAACTAVDVTSRTTVEAFVSFATTTFGQLDAYVNNAGMARLSRIDALDVADWEKMIDVNFKGVLYGFAAAIPAFEQHGHGHIVNIISTAGLKIVPTMGVYAATKNAVRTISECFRQESDGRIRITGISPGYVKTEFNDYLKEGNEGKTHPALELMEKIAIRPEDIAETVSFALRQPPEVEIGDIAVRPAVQN